MIRFTTLHRQFSFCVPLFRRRQHRIRSSRTPRLLSTASGVRAPGYDDDDGRPALERSRIHQKLRLRRKRSAAENDDDETLRFAVLVDAENTSPRIFGPVLSEVSDLGDTFIRRLYGDFDKQYLTSWIGLAEEHSCELMESLPYTKGKNSSDFAMTIDAMDLLHTEPEIGGFCLVSSDSDFTGLALRLRRSGKYVLGIGRCSTPKCFVRACNDFIMTKGRLYERELSPESVNMLRCVVRKVDEELERDGWILYTHLVSHLIDKEVDLPSLHHGYKSLWHCMASLRGHFELTYLGGSPHVRIKPGSDPDEKSPAGIAAY